jgi:hypothetical protein
MSMSQHEANAMADLRRRVEEQDVRLRKLEELTGLGPSVETLLSDGQRRLMDAFRMTAPSGYRVLPLADQKRPATVRAFSLLSPAGAQVAECAAREFGEDEIKDWIALAVQHAQQDGAPLPPAPTRPPRPAARS